MNIIISSGHGKYVSGASDILNEVTEARKVVEKVAEYLRQAKVGVTTFHDNVSTTQSQNLNTIVNFHNGRTRDLDVSVHFNANKHTSKPVGTECLYVTQDELADKVSEAISTVSGLIDRGGKYRGNLAFLNGTTKPAILIEVCFVDSEADANIYRQEFNSICRAIAETISDTEIPEEEVPPTSEIPRIDIKTTGVVDIYVNGVLVISAAPLSWNENITATVFAGEDDPQDSAYGTGRIDGDAPGVSLPYKWREESPPDVIVSGPRGEIRAPMVDVGPWNTDDPSYVLEGTRPLVEEQYAEGIPAQNGRIPTNDAAIDLTPATAEAIGIDGKGKVKWRFA